MGRLPVVDNRVIHGYQKALQGPEAAGSFKLKGFSAHEGMKVFVIGTGNVATSLGRALVLSGHRVIGVLGRNILKTQQLAAKLKCPGFTEPGKIPLNADVYLLAIKDDAIDDVVTSLPRVKGIVAHTSGASPMSLLKRFRKKGVFYPVETITRQYPRTFKSVPVCIEASDETTFRKLTQLGRSVSNEIYALDSNQRAVLHLAAVFTNNFTNYLLGVSTDILSNYHLPSSLIKKLAESTVKNVFEKGAFLSQTGPAVRNDRQTIKKHLQLLRNHKDYQQLYRLITGQISSVHNKQHK